MIRFLFLYLALFLVFPVNLNGQNYLISRSSNYADGTSPTYRNVGAGDTVWIEAGLRSNLLIADFHGAEGNPVVFANRNGKVIIETDLSFGINFRGCSYFVLAGLPGTGYEYGIMVARVQSSSGCGISAGNKSTNMVIQGCEVTQTGFAGIMIKTEPVCDDPGTYRDAFTQFNTVIRNCYIHDVGGEGMYIGSSKYSGQVLSPCGITVYPPVLIGTDIGYNRIERTGLDGIQVSSAVQDCLIHHNYLKDCSYLMTDNQMSGIIIGGGTLAECYNNQIIDCYSTGILVFGNGGTEVFNNLIVRPGKKFLPDNPEKPQHGIFISDKTNLDKTWYGVYQNTIIQPKSDGVRIDNTVDFEIRIYNNAIIDPGAYHYYENDNTDRTGLDSYVFDTSREHRYRAENNYFSRLFDTAGFSDYESDNYRLRPNSPMVDAGKSLQILGVITDLDDRSRPAGIAYDIGAFEYTPGMSSEESPFSDKSGGYSCQILPNGIMRLTSESSQDQKILIRISDLTGRSLYTSARNFPSDGQQTIEIQLPYTGLMIVSVQGLKSSYVSKIVLY
ncbi:MAG: right-handed parallel beta-helix repeat-containing protein [Bacteroidales bacterium]|nr:right-handed parallel beta-helix repeat-containing protein [Bacteroidales bacterium]